MPTHSTPRWNNAPTARAVPNLRGPIVRRSVKDQVGETITALITSGILQVGDALPGERDLAAALNVSRETVRGAVQMLAARGVLDVSHGTRTRVVRADVGRLAVGFAGGRPIDGYDLDTVHASRLLVERQLVGDAAERIGAATLHGLDMFLAAQRAALEDPVRFLISDREFHVAIYRASGNRLLADFATDLYAYMMDHRRLAVARPGAIARSYRDHVAIVDALRRHDAEAAVSAFATHANRIYDTTQSVINEHPGPR